MSILSGLSTGVKDRLKIMARAKQASKENSALHVQKPGVSVQRNRERMTEREFVRAFGTKVVKVRYSNRADFVGLMILGKYQGFLIVQDGAMRKLRLIDVDDQGVVKLTHRFLPVKDNESISNLQRGLLKWVR